MSEMENLMLDLSIGRASNDILETTTRIWWKHEYSGADGDNGPIYLETADGRMHPFNNGQAEWFPYEAAQALGHLLDAEVTAS